jgi:hypothetical protein
MSLYVIYHALGVAESVVCIIAWIPVTYLLKNMFAHKATHINFRILLCYTILEYQLIISTRVLARYMKLLDQQYLYWPIVVCNVLTHWFLNQSIFSTLLLTIERCISTMQSSCYERSGPILSILATGTIVSQ